MERIKPYSDEYMTFDEFTKHYYLTEKAVLDELGIDLISAAKTQAYGDIQVKQILKTVSMHCYKYIHEFTTRNDFQDGVIATTEEGRNLIFRAMLEQFLYVKKNGDLLRSIDRERRALYMDETAKSILNEPLKCLNGGLLTFCGV